MAKLNIIQAVNQALKQEMETDKSMLVLGEDVGVDGGVFRATDSLLTEYGEKRVFDTPLSEAGIIGASIGLATQGFKPVAEVQFSGFMYPGFDQLISHASRMRTRSRGRFTCPMVVRSPYSGGIRALEHHSESFEAIYAHIPGLKVVIPSGPYNTKGLLTAAIRDPDPVIFLEPKRVYRAIKEEVPEKQYEIPLGQCNIVEEGNDVTVISWGAALKTTKQAIADVDAELIDVQTIYPLDTKTILNSVKKTGRCLIVHEAPKTGGLGAEITAEIMDKAILHLQAPVARVTGYDTVFPLYKLEQQYLPDEGKVKLALQKLMAQ